MPNFIDLKDRVFGRLKVLERSNEIGSKRGAIWLCVCDCGSSISVRGDSLRSGVTNSCGCYHSDKVKTHGKTGTPVYKCWQHMVQRCYNENRKAYKDYGGRGIKVCDRWLEPAPNGFLNFLEDMGESRGLTLDRIDVDGDYCKDNCRWADWVVQANNRRHTVSSASGRMGVYKVPSGWRATIRRNYKYQNLGIFETFEQACEARSAAELKFKEEFMNDV